MPLQFKDAPINTQEQLSRAYDLLSSNEMARSGKTSGGHFDGPKFEAAFPHPVYTLGLAQVEQRVSIAASAQQVSWRYIIPQSNPASAAEVSLEKGGPRFAELNYGPYARNTLEEIQRLQKVPQFTDTDYEVRLLRIPALTISALWLRDYSGKEVFIPLSPTSAALQPGQPYSEEDLFNKIMPEARRKHGEDTRPMLASAHEIKIAVNSLSPAELLRLQKYASWRMRPVYHKARGRDAEDLLQEAILATIEGRRVWNRDISLLQHLVGTIQSISTNWRESVGEEYSESDLPAETVRQVFELPGRSPDPERILRAKQELQQIESLFVDDPEALEIVHLLAQGYSAKQIQLHLQISDQQLAAGIKRVRRAVARQKLEQIKKLCASDEEALKIADMLAQGYNRQQIQSRLGMSDKQLVAATKRVAEPLLN